MKRNFYLQHPIMAMNDPRMKKLIDKERLKGSGAYWFIIEKLALLPEPRAQLEYLQPFCVGRKIPLSYLQKIIREYDLFIFDEDNYFTPAELNPAKKKDEKSVENVSGTDVSVSENNRKVQKTSRKKAEKESLKVGNSLNGSLLPKDTPAIGKENIKDIKTNEIWSATDDNNCEQFTVQFMPDRNQFEKTEEEIKKGIREAKELTEYDSLADSAYLRAKEDYLIGINFSRLLTIIYGKRAASKLQEDRISISVGRVMTCVLGMVVAREREIRNFTKIPYYKIVGEFGQKDKSFTAEWKVTENSSQKDSVKLYNETGFKKEKDAKEFIIELSNKKAIVKEVKKSVEGDRQ